MRRNPRFFLRFVFLAFCCFNFSIVFGQTSDRADLTGNYAGSLKFPSANLNGKATLSVEGNKFLLRSANGSEKAGRITAIKTGGDYVSIALMFEETPQENQPFAHSMMSVRLRKTGKNLIFTSAPGEEREFRFEAVSETANNKTEKITDARLIEPTKAECADPKSAKCGVNFGFVTADELEKAAAPKTISDKKAESKTTALTAKAQNNTFAATTLKLETATESKQPEPANENRTTPETSQTEPTPVVEKQTQTLEGAPITTEAKPQDEASLSVVKQATDEMRRATLELKRATDEIKTTTDELRRFRTESPAKTTAANTEKVEKTNLKNASTGAPFKSSAANSNKTTRKSPVSRKSTTKKPAQAKTNFSKIASVKPTAKKSGSKPATPKSLTKKESAKPAEQTEKAKAPKAAETKPSTSPSPKPSPSPASSPNQNANNADVGKSPK
ncbi:MAG TPA: hypothetical protein VF596_18395 [Pyrinomonadaceae bacterium]|jgi:hypothetical protein